MNRRKTYSAIAILTFAIAFSLVSLPAIAQPGVTLKTYPFIDAIPNPVGVGQDTLIRFGILQQLPNVAYGYSGLTVTITKPDGTTETLGPYKTDSTGGTYALYTPNREGTYKLKLNFPEQIWTFGDFYSFESGATIYNGTTMAASTAEIELVVQQEPLQYYPGHPLPSEYWTRPIDSQLREWASIAGNWMERPANGIAENNDAPETAHVLWAKQLTTGGLTGGLWGDGVPAGAETGDAYEGKWSGSVILNGILYYRRTDPGTTSTLIAVDLHTGVELWRIDNRTLSFGQIFYFNSWNYDGVFTYLVSVTGSTYDFYDPFTGNWQFGFNYVPSGTRVFGPSGEILIYQINYAAGWMALWNSSAAGHAHLGAMGPSYGSWGSQVHGAYRTANVSRAYSWNVTIPTGLSASSVKVYVNDRLVGLYVNRTIVRVWALNLKGLTATSTSTSTLFDRTWNAPSEWLAGSNTVSWSAATNQVEKGVISVWNKELRKHYGFSVEDGRFMWETDSEHFLDAYGWGAMEHTWYFAYGKLYSVGVGGILYAYDDQTGKTAWTYTLSDAYSEPVTGNNWWGWIALISDGKVYVGHLEHSAEQPLPRGAPFVCLNATTGDVIWRVNGMFRETRWGGNPVIGDSIIAAMDTYDQRIYAIGKGPSATTVTASPEISVHGSKVLVKGMVTDISPGTDDIALKKRFPNGVPAVADESMSDWMLYVYKQFERPADVKGVEVVVEVLDPNNNYYEVARATTDGSGFYSATFEPPVPGKYTIVASFKGSKAYYGSYAQTAIVVEDAPPPTPPPTPTPASVADIYFLPVSAGMIIAIVIVLVLLILLFRKK